MNEMHLEDPQMLSILGYQEAWKEGKNMIPS